MRLKQFSKKTKFISLGMVSVVTGSYFAGSMIQQHSLRVSATSDLERLQSFAEQTQSQSTGGTEIPRPSEDLILDANDPSATIPAEDLVPDYFDGGEPDPYSQTYDYDNAFRNTDTYDTYSQTGRVPSDTSDLRQGDYSDPASDRMNVTNEAGDDRLKAFADQARDIDADYPNAVSIKTSDTADLMQSTPESHKTPVEDVVDDRLKEFSGQISDINKEYGSPTVVGTLSDGGTTLVDEGPVDVRMSDFARDIAKINSEYADRAIPDNVVVMNDNGEPVSTGTNSGIPERKPLLSESRFKNVSLHEEESSDNNWYEAVEDQSSVIQTVSSLQNYNFNNYQNMTAASINIPVITPGAVRSLDNITSAGEFPTTNWQRYGSRLVDLGDFILTAYDACMLCCGKTDGITATKTKCFSGRTIAVDPKVIPYGSKVLIGGYVFIAEDTGGKIKGKHIDMYMDTHETAKLFGRRTANVQLIVD